MRKSSQPFVVIVVFYCKKSSRFEDVNKKIYIHREPASREDLKTTSSAATECKG